jgi:hypothetical protein
LLDDFFDGELSNDAAQVAFHHQADQAFAFLIALGQKLLGCGEDRFFVGLHLDLSHGFDSDRYALLGVEVLLGRDVERHQFERKTFGIFDHRKDDRAVALNHARSAKAVDDQRFVWSGLAV